MTNVEQEGQVTDQVSVVLMVSVDACTQVIQGSNPTDGWKVMGMPQPFPAVAFNMIYKGTREGAHSFFS